MGALEALQLGARPQLSVGHSVTGVIIISCSEALFIVLIPFAAAAILSDLLSNPIFPSGSTSKPVCYDIVISLVSATTGTFLS